jgi:putative phosphoesterase
MELAILSDTHIPGQAGALPDAFRDRVREADHVVHAGDFGSAGAYTDVATLADGLTAVYGNADPRGIDLPPVASIRVGSVTFVVVHAIVNPVERAVSSSEAVVTDREEWLAAVADVTRARAGETAVGIGGHSHEVEDVVHEGVRLLNPGSATDVGRAEGATMMTAEVDDDDFEVTVHEL